jgi:hypothetical protein
MFEAKAVWKTEVEGEFEPAGFHIMVTVEPISTNIMPDSMSLLYQHINDGRCDGFIIDMFTQKKYVIKSQGEEDESDRI